MPLEKLKNDILSKGNIPEHIAIIMDGNGRWAKKRGLPRTAGHKAGVKSVKKIVQIGGEIDLKYLTVFTFSTENWKRPKSEVSALMKLLGDTTRRELAELLENNVRLTATGDLSSLPITRRQILRNAIKKTKNNTGLTLNLALNYSGRSEIIYAVKNIVRDATKGAIKPGQIDDKLFSSYLQTAGIPEPDLLIRTSGELRLSNFLLWQTAYTEMYITDTLWPDFDEKDFLMAIKDYQSRERRFGQVLKS